MLERHPEWGEKVREKSDGAALLLAVVTVTAPRIMLYRQARSSPIPPQGGIPNTPPQPEPAAAPTGRNGAIDLDAMRERMAADA